MMMGNKLKYVNKIYMNAFSMMQNDLEEESRMVIEHFKQLLSNLYLQGEVDAKQHARIEALLDSVDKENKKLGVKLIEQKSGKTIELQKHLGDGTRKTVTVEKKP